MPVNGSQSLSNGDTSVLTAEDLKKLNEQLAEASKSFAQFHGDALIGVSNPQTPDTID
jgi:hypothetical protein